jgi:outer membrane protein OmpA-like peptidoglycan-associated protein
MRKRLCTSLCVLPVAMCITTIASAQEGSFSLSASPQGADASATSTSPAEPAAPSNESEVLHHPFELGIFLGGLFPPEQHALYEVANPDGTPRTRQRYESVAAAFGARAAWLPIRYVGVEGEALIAPTSDLNGGAANLFALRAHAILQVPTEAITPFLTVGGGTFWVDGEKLGEDSDNAFTLGIGAKIPLSDTLRARIDLRDNLLPKQGDLTEIPDWYEVTFGLTWGFGGKRPPPPPPAPVDSDGDGLTDDIDQCPVAPANTPDGCPIPDTDGDGVLDNVDECPQEPGTLANGCPDLDPDKDGVPLPDDKCPDVAGIAPDGCPDPDPDRDGIPLPQDKCPDEPETINNFEDDDGCPDEVPEVVKKFTGVIKGIQFDFGKTTIRKQSYPLLDDAAKVLTDHPSLRLEISGHTDSVGTRERNIEISRARAEAVKEYLVGKGIDANRLVTRGAGPDEPVADNKTKAGQAENRRIEFKMIAQ